MPLLPGAIEDEGMTFNNYWMNDLLLSGSFPFLHKQPSTQNSCSYQYQKLVSYLLLFFLKSGSCWRARWCISPPTDFSSQPIRGDRDLVKFSKVLFCNWATLWPSENCKALLNITHSKELSRESRMLQNTLLACHKQAGITCYYCHGLFLSLIDLKCCVFLGTLTQTWEDRLRIAS